MHIRIGRKREDGGFRRRSPGCRRGASYLPLVILAIFAMTAVTALLLYFLNQLEELAGPMKEHEARVRVTSEGPKIWPNVVLISVDGLRPDHLHCCGYERETSPNLDRLAAAGVCFEKVFSTTSWSLPAHAALMTGLPDQVHGVVTTGRSLHADWPLLAERFRMRGYATAGFYSGPFLHPFFGFDRGFDHYVSCMIRASVFDRYRASDPAPLTPEERERWEAERLALLGDRSADRVTQAALAWLEGLEGPEGMKKPFFLFLHLYDVHYDYVPPAAFDRFAPGYRGRITGRGYEDDSVYHPGMDPEDLKRVITLYDGEILWVDSQVGLLLDWIEDRGLTKDTLIAVTAGHGQAFFEHGERAHRNRNGLFGEVLRVPFILSYPARVARGRRINGQAGIIDIMPTLLDLAEIAVPYGVKGKSLKGFVLPEPSTNGTAPSSLVISEVSWPASGGGGGGGDPLDRILSLRSEAYHLTWFPATGRTLLFHMDEDPGEAVDLAAQRPQVAARLLEALRRQDRALLRLCRPGPGEGTAKLTPLQIEELESLGPAK